LISLLFSPTFLALSFIPPADLTVYTSLFNSAPPTPTYPPIIPPAIARSILLQSSLPQHILAQIWNLSSIRPISVSSLDSGGLCWAEFCLAMYLCKLSMGGVPPPPRIPDHIKNEVEQWIRQASSSSIGFQQPQQHQPQNLSSLSRYGTSSGTMNMPTPSLGVSNSNSGMALSLGFNSSNTGQTGGNTFGTMKMPSANIQSLQGTPNFNPIGASSTNSLLMGGTGGLSSGNIQLHPSTLIPPQQQQSQQGSHTPYYTPGITPSASTMSRSSSFGGGGGIGSPTGIQSTISLSNTKQSLTGDNRDIPWAITFDEKARYDVIFSQWEDGNGFITGNLILLFFEIFFVNLLF